MNKNIVLAKKLVALAKMLVEAKQPLLSDEFARDDDPVEHEPLHTMEVEDLLENDPMYNWISSLRGLMKKYLLMYGKNKGSHVRFQNLGILEKLLYEAIPALTEIWSDPDRSSPHIKTIRQKGNNWVWEEDVVKDDTHIWNTPFSRLTHNENFYQQMIVTLEHLLRKTRDVLGHQETPDKIEVPEAERGLHGQIKDFFDDLTMWSEKFKKNAADLIAQEGFGSSLEESEEF